MSTKDEINKIVTDRLGNPAFVKLWWLLRLPAFGGDRVVEAFEKDEQRVLEYVKSY